MKITKSILKVCFGLDISMKTFSVALGILYADTNRDIILTREFKNDMTGFKKFLKFIEAMKKKYCADPATRLWFVMEATGVYHENLAYFLHDNGFDLSVVLANKMNNFGKTLTVKSKTDRLDAKKIATFAIEKQLEKWAPADSAMKQIKELGREINDLNEELNRAENRLHAKQYSYKPDKDVIKRIKQQIGFIKKQISKAKKQIKEASSKNEMLSHKISNITKIKGLGDYTVAVILAETDCFSKTNNIKQLTSYSGMDVRINQSGKKDGKRSISKRGNSNIRKALYMPSLSCLKHEPIFKNLYDRLCKRYNFKNRKRAVMAVMRKLLIMIYTLWNKNIPFESDYCVNNSLAVV